MKPNSLQTGLRLNIQAIGIKEDNYHSANNTSVPPINASEDRSTNDTHM